MLYHQSEWESVSGWHCNCVDNLGKDSGAWWHPARILGVSPAQFIAILIERFKPDTFYYNADTCFCTWSWKSQAAMREFKNFINKKAREVNYQI